MCFLTDLFKKRKETPPSPPPLTLPHPEEQADFTINMSNFDLNKTFDEWIQAWAVPNKDFWHNAIVIEVTDTIPYPAQTWEQDGKRHLAVRPEWLNPGVIAHEQAHNSYALLSQLQKEEFSRVYTPLKDTAPLIKLLYSLNAHGLTNDIEGHAECYRFLGNLIPETLKPYYPKLFY